MLTTPPPPIHCASENVLTRNVFQFFFQICLAAGPIAVPLGTAANFAVLAKSTISTVPASAISKLSISFLDDYYFSLPIAGNIGSSPAAATDLAGFTLKSHSKRRQDLCYFQTVGDAYVASYTSPTPETLTIAISDMATAYTNASGQLNPNYTNLDSGEELSLICVLILG